MTFHRYDADQISAAIKVLDEHSCQYPSAAIVLAARRGWDIEAIVAAYCARHRDGDAAKLTDKERYWLLEFDGLLAGIGPR